MANRYWIGGTGTWNGTNTAEWSAESGGAGGASAPTVLDDVFFDAKSGLTSAAVVTVAAGAVCRNLTIEGLGEVRTTWNQSSATFEPAGAVSIKGKNEAFQLFWKSSVTGTQRVFKIGALTALANIDFADVKGEGAAAPFAGEFLGDAEGNAGITFAEGKTQTRKGVGGNWSDPTKWSERVPMPQDPVLVGAEASGTITVDMPRLGHGVDFTGFTGKVKWSTATAAYGSVLLAAGMTVEGTSGTLTLGGRATGLELKTAGITLLNAVTLNCPGGKYKLVDNLTLSAKTLTVAMGTLDFNGKNVTCSIFSLTNKLGHTYSGLPTTITLTSTAAGTIWNSTLNTEAYCFELGQNLTIIIANASANNRTFDGLGENYGELRYTVAGSAGSLTITGAAEFTTTFNTLSFSDATNSRALILPKGQTVRVTNFNVFGTPGKLIELVSSLGGTKATLDKGGGGNATVEYLTIKDSQATPGSTWTALNSTNGGNNTGWKFVREGEATANLNLPITATGGMITNGAASTSLALLVVGESSTAWTGAATVELGCQLSVEGVAVHNGEALVSLALTIDGPSSAVSNGETSAVLDLEVLADGAATFSGEVTAEGSLSAEADGGIAAVAAAVLSVGLVIEAEGEPEALGAVEVGLGLGITAVGAVYSFSSSSGSSYAGLGAGSYPDKDAEAYDTDADSTYATSGGAGYDG